MVGRAACPPYNPGPRPLSSSVEQPAFNRLREVRFLQGAPPRPLTDRGLASVDQRQAGFGNGRSWLVCRLKRDGADGDVEQRLRPSQRGFDVAWGVTAGED